MPFEFRIPTQIPASSTSNIFEPDREPQQLYPSMKTGYMYQEPKSDKTFAQPFIVYRLSASIRLEGNPNISQRDFARHIAIMPTTTCPPPMDASAFRGEFWLHAESELRRHIYSHSIGSLEFTTEEPQAIHVNKFIVRPQTIVSLKLSFQQAITVPGLKNCGTEMEIQGSISPSTSDLLGNKAYDSGAHSCRQQSAAYLSTHGGTTYWKERIH